MNYRNLKIELEEVFTKNSKGFSGSFYETLKYMYFNTKDLIINYCYLDSIRLDLADNYLNNNMLYEKVKEELEYTIELIFNKYKNDKYLSFSDEENLEYDYLTYYYNIIKY